MQNNLRAAKDLLRPLLKNPVSQVFISFVVGYYATTKIVQIFREKNKPPNQQQGDEELQLPASSSESSLLEVTNCSQQQQQLPKGRDALLLTTQQLGTFDGRQEGRPLYTALNGKIYDLSNSREQFAQQGPYSLFAGCNANDVLEIACGSMGVDAHDVVQRWEQSFNAEFNVVGYLIDAYAGDREEDELDSLEDARAGDLGERDGFCEDGASLR